MAKKNNKPAIPAAPAAPAAKTPETSVTTPMQQATQMFGQKSSTDLDANHTVELLGMLHDRFYKDPEAAKHTGFPEESIYKINEITACGLVVVMAEQITNGNTEFAARMRPTQLQSMIEVGASMGINIDASKALPAPDNNEVVELPATAVEVSEETKKKLAEEKAAAEKKVELDPTKITNDEELVDALKQIMITRPNLYQKIAESINFYRAYRGVQANKSGKKEDTEAIKNMSNVEIFSEISELVGKCPLVLSGVGNHLYTVTAQTKSPIAAFCALRNSTRDRKTGVYAIDDATVAEYIKILIKWNVDLKTVAAQTSIETAKKDIALLSDDKEKNAAGIADLEEKIATQEKNIAHFNDVLSCAMNPTSEFVNNFETNYLAHEKNEMKVFKSIADSYYDDIELKEMKTDGVRHNIVQYAGIITNLFRDPLTPLEEYNASNLVELEPMQATEEPETPAEESKKD